MRLPPSSLVPLMIMCVAGCDRLSPTANDWPLRVKLGGGSREALQSDVSPCDTLGAHETIAVPGGTVRASDFLVSPEGDYVLVAIGGGPRWVRARAPLSESQRQFVLSLAGRGAHCVVVHPFADGVRAIAVAEGSGTLAIELRSGRKRRLDNGTLEGCRMDRGRETFTCSLDLSPESARFDPDGNELEGTFQPDWTR